MAAVMYLFIASLLIISATSQSFNVLSIDHDAADDGTYFNFNIADVDAILGRTDWDNEVFTIRNSRLDGAIKVRLWRAISVWASAGDGHGRREPKDQSHSKDWQVGDTLSFVEDNEVFTVLSTEHNSWFSGRKYFHFDAATVDALLGRNDWNGEVFTINNGRFNGALQVKLWRDANGGSEGDAHGRREPKEHASNSDWLTGDVLTFIAEGATGTNNAAYTHAIGLEAFYYAFGAQCAAEYIETWTNGLPEGPDNVKSFELSAVITTDALQAFVGYDVANSRIVMSFRGSQNKENWDSNFDYKAENYPNAPQIANAMIHPGFYEAFKVLEAGGLYDAIADMVDQHPGSDILSTGHSLGGALCAVAALELKQSPLYSELDIGNVDVIALGMPRVFSPQLAALFEEVIRTSWRIVNRYDIVVTIPTKSMGYWHIGTEVWYKWQRMWADMDPISFKLCNGSGEDKACFGTDFWIDRVPIIAHHTEYFGLDRKVMCKAVDE